MADLKRELKVRGLSIAGNKNELQERLQAAMVGEPLLEDSSLVGEDILDEEGVLSDEEKILGTDENELLKSPTTTPTTILPKTLGVGDNKDANTSNIEDDILESPTTTTKKIILKRKSSLNSGSTLEANNSTTKENTEPSPAKAVKMSERNPITIGDDKKTDNNQTNAVAATKKLKELTMQERLELRAKKFGLDTKTAATTAATPAAMSAKDKNAISVAPVVSSEKQVELLKKRAERFGCVTSTNLAKLDAQERLLKRKQRFGGSEANKTTENNTNSSTTTPTGENKDEWAEKARKRLERFKGQTTPSVTVAAAATPATTAATTTPAPAATAATSS